MTAAAVAATFLLVLSGAALVWRAPPTAPRLSIAVLPFRSLGTDTGQADLADALTDDLTTDLAHIPASTVIARESADVWRGKAATVQQIARSLRVRYIVEGSIMKEESQYHVNAQLIDADTGAHLWASRFEAPQGRLGDVRDAIVRKLATQLGFQLEQVESARSINDRPDDPDALDLFFRARALLNANDSLSSLIQAQALLEQALKQQPSFADAAAELGAMLLEKLEDMDDVDEIKDLAEAHKVLAEALKLAPRNSKALAAHARELAIRGLWVEAAYSARTALSIEPSNVDALAVLSRCLRSQGRLEEAASAIHDILRLTPDSVSNWQRYVTLSYIMLLQSKTRELIDLAHIAMAGDDTIVSTSSFGRVRMG